MKKLLCIILVLCCFAGITGCGAEPIPEDSYTVYYRQKNPAYGNPDGVIAQTYLLTAGHEDDIPYLLRKYLVSTPGDDLISPFPETISLINFKQEGPTVKIVLSNEIANLSGMELTIALTCLTRTVVSLTNCQEVIISAATAQLDGQNYITLTPDSFLFLDESSNAEKDK